MEAKKKNKLFYGWLIVFACLVVQAIPFGVAQNVQPQFIKFVCEGEGFTLTQFALIFTIGTIVSAFVSPFIGALFNNEKINIKILYSAGAVLSGGGFLLYTFCNSLWQYYSVAAVVQVGTAIISAIGVPVLINLWFKENTGFALGLAFAGGGIGNVFLQQIAAYLLSHEGYKSAYMFFGILSMVVAFPIALVFIRKPKQVELENYAKELQAKKDTNNQTNNSDKVISWGFTIKELMSKPLFWIFLLGFFCVGIYVSSISVQFMNYLYSIGFNAQYVGNIGSVFAACSIAGNLGGGTLFDKIGINKCLILGGILVVTCGISLLFVGSIPALGYLFAACLGFSVYAYIISPSYLTGKLFGNKQYGTILGIINIFFALGYSIGSIIFSLIIDNIGSYTVAWIYAIVATVIAYVCLLGAAINFKKLAAAKQAESNSSINQEIASSNT